MSTWLPEVEGWVKVAGAAVAVVMAVLVPIRSWIAEDRRHRTQALETIAAIGRSSNPALTAAPQLLADSMALAAVADALQDVAGSLRTLVEGDEGRSGDRLARALEAFLDSERSQGRARGRGEPQRTFHSAGQ